MLRNDVSYPYPVLRTFLSDYKESYFYSDIKIDVTPTGYRIFLDFSINNDRISKLIDKGILSYALYLSCPRTLMREMRYLNPDTEYIDVPAESVHYRVEYAAYIIATQDIDGYTDEDFGEGFEDINYNISKGSVFGIGRSGHFDALFDKDVIRDAGTIIQVMGSDNEKYMKVDLSGKTIIVLMPMEQSRMYKSMPKSKKTQTFLHAVVTIPALVEAINMIARVNGRHSPEDEECSERPWFLTLVRAIKELSETTGEKEQDLYDYPLKTAQMIMKNNSKAVLKLIEGEL